MKTKNYIIIGFVSAIVSLFLFPPIFGVLAIYCGYVLKKRNYPTLGLGIIGLGALFTILGMALGVTNTLNEFSIEVPSLTPSMTQEKFKVQTCPVCPQRSNWSECVDFAQYRVKYHCDVSTNYKCIPEKEIISCIPLNESERYIKREYKWTFKGNEYTWSPIFPKSVYDYYKNKPRPLTRDYSIYATDPYDDKLISQLVSVFRNASERDGFDKYETVNFVISFVQSLPYTPDNVTTPFDEYPRYPIETLVDNGGDCEDTSILTAVLIDELGYGVVLLEIPKHMAVGVKCEESMGAHYKDDYGNSFCYLETTSKDWEIGQIPDNYKGSGAILRYLVPKPLITITIDWSSKGVSASLFYVTYEINITVKNEGSATAENLKIWTGFDATEEGKVYSQIVGKTYNLEPSEKLNSIVTLSVPREVYTRLHIIVSGDNFFPQEEVSEWFKT